VWYRENELNSPLWLSDLTPAAADDASQPLGTDELMQLQQQVLVALGEPTSAANNKPVQHPMMHGDEANADRSGQ
jgi:hypothetical protein